MGKQIGRILSSNSKTAKAEFTEDTTQGMLVEVKRGGERYIARVEHLKGTKYDGLIGHMVFLDLIDRPFRSMTPIYIADEEMERGIFLIGYDERDLPVKLSLNPLFAHMLLAGTTTVGKTHLLIALCEEFIKYKVPCLVIDPHGECIHLPEFNQERVELVEDLRMENLATMMRLHKVVVWNLLGLTKKEKVQRVAGLLTALMAAKETDYRQADENTLLLELPPMIVMIDEADIFAPNFRKQMREPREAVGPVMDILNKGAKFGLGAILATQRITRMEIDVRSQCNSAVVFRISNDPGSLQAVHSIDYVPKSYIEKIKGFTQGQCLICGIAVHRPRIIITRDIVTKRAKSRNYEKMLGIERPEEEEFVPMLAMNGEGDLIDKVTGDIVEDGLDRIADEDRHIFEKAEGDGVILRSHITPEEQKILNKLRKPNEKGERLIG